LIAANEKTNELLKEQRQSLIYEAVTGKKEAIDIRNSYPK